ncbi:MAG: elongation factor G [Oscillospiraceae bacterium]
MSKFNADNIKNVALAGHNGSGKTSLAEAILYKAGITDKLGKVADGSTIMDYDKEEINRKVSINTSMASFVYDDKQINLIDTPGLLDFESEMIEGIHASGTVIITVSAKSGVKTGTKKAYETAIKLNKSTIFAVTKIDDENANFYNTLTQLKTVFGSKVCPVIVPVVKNGKIDSYINLIEQKCYKYDGDGIAKEIPMPKGDITDKMDYRLDGLINAMCEAVAETDEALMEKFFDGEPFTQKELIDAIHVGMNDGVITPVMCVSSTTLDGVDMLLKEMSLLFPSPNERPIPTAKDKNGIDVNVLYDENAPLSALVFKTVADAFVGKMSYIKVKSGVLKSNSECLNFSSGKVEKIGKLYKMVGKKQVEVPEIVAGDIGVTIKIDAITSDTLCDAVREISFPRLEFPHPCYSKAVTTKQGDEAKVSSALQKIVEEDTSISCVKNPDTNQLILSGLGDQHLDVITAKLKNKFGVTIELSKPKIAYKETIKKKVKKESKYKKQSGGHGQYGHVIIEFEPCLSDSLVFEEKVFGGSVPKNYFPAVEKGIIEGMKKGILAGCEVVNIKATLLDGSYHPVDSSEMAFKTASSMAFKEAMRDGDPTILEPVGTLKAIVPEANTGDILGELNKRRGRTLGMNPLEKSMTEIVAEVPAREMSDFALYMRQTTRGLGSFTFDFERYEQLPSNLVASVIAEVNS